MSKKSSIILGTIAVTVVLASVYLKSENIELGFFNSDATDGMWSCDSAGKQFCPEAPMTKAQVAHVVATVLHLMPDRANPLTFSDISPSDPYLPDVIALVQEGILPPCDSESSSYCPEMLMRRNQAAIVVARAFKLSTKNANQEFADVPTNRESFPYINALAHNGVSLGCGFGSVDGKQTRMFCPNQALTRAQLALWIGKLGNFSKTYDGQFEDVALIYPGIQYIFGVASMLDIMPFVKISNLNDVYFKVPSIITLKEGMKGVATHEGKLILEVMSIADDNLSASIVLGRNAGCTGEYQTRCARDEFARQDEIVMIGSTISMLGLQFRVDSISNGEITVSITNE